MDNGDYGKNGGHLEYRKGQKRVGRGILGNCIMDLIVSHNIAYDPACADLASRLGHRASE